MHVRVELEVGAEHVTADRKDVQLSWGVGVGGPAGGWTGAAGEG